MGPPVVQGSLGGSLNLDTLGMVPTVLFELSLCWPLCPVLSPFSPATHPLQPGRQLPPCPPVSGDIPRCPVPLLVSDSLCPSCHTSCSALIPAAKSGRNPPYCSHHKSASLKNTFTSFQSNLTSVLSALALRTGPWADAHVVMPQGPHMNRSTCGTCSSQHRAWFSRRP